MVAPVRAADSTQADDQAPVTAELDPVAPPDPGTPLLPVVSAAPQGAGRVQPVAGAQVLGVTGPFRLVGDRPVERLTRVERLSAGVSWGAIRRATSRATSVTAPENPPALSSTSMFQSP